MPLLRHLWAGALSLMIGAAAPALAQADRPWVDPPPRAAPPSAETPPATTTPPEAPRPPAPSPQTAPTPSPSPAAPRVQTPPQPSQSPAPEAPRRAEPPRPLPPAAEPPRSARPTAPEPEREREASPRPRDEGARAPAGRERAARRLAADYLDYWSAPNAVTLDATPDFYAPRVEFHGREMSARALYEEKRRFVRRWPLRHYVPRPESTEATCSPSGQTCTVRTTFDYSASNPESGRRSQGVANLELLISFAGDAPVIVAETSRVVRSGRTAPLPLEDDEE